MTQWTQAELDEKKAIDYANMSSDERAELLLEAAGYFDNQPEDIREIQQDWANTLPRLAVLNPQSPPDYLALWAQKCGCDDLPF